MKKIVTLYYTTRYSYEINLEDLANEWGCSVEDLTDEDLVQAAREAETFEIEGDIMSNLNEVDWEVTDE